MCFVPRSGSRGASSIPQFKIGKKLFLIQKTTMYTLCTVTPSITFVSLWIVSVILFALYLEYGKGMGGVLIRKNGTGSTSFAPMNVVRVMFWPFREKALWHVNHWDINYWMIGMAPTLILSIGYIYLYKHVGCDIQSG